eukprot:765730-Hanusia_phi.AAC.2
MSSEGSKLSPIQSKDWISPSSPPFDHAKERVGERFMPMAGCDGGRADRTGGVTLSNVRASTLDIRREGCCERIGRERGSDMKSA